MTRLKLLWVGDSPTISTGFGVVGKNLLDRFSKAGYEIGVLGVNHYGDPYDPKKFPYPIWGGDKGDMEAIFGMQKLWKIVADFQPDVLFFLNDPWLLKDYMNHKPDNIRLPKTIAYYPTDAAPLKKSWIEILNGFDAQVCYSNYAERVVTESNGGVRPDNLHQVYHGVDTTAFFPVSQSQAREKLGIPTDTFVVGMVARNQFRKRFDILADAFSRFAKDKPEARLYMHTALHDIGFDITDLIKQTGIADKTILTQGLRPDHLAEIDQLNLIYNSFDVNALISLGDGFGLPVAESMATGCSQLVSGHSCLQELVEGHGGLTVKTATWAMNPQGINTWGGYSDVNDIVDKLQQLYESKDLRLKFSEEGYNFIHQEKFSWDYAFEQFDQIIKSLFHLL